VELIQGQPRGFGTNPAFDDFNANGPRGGGRSCGISGALAVSVIRQIDRTEPWSERRRICICRNLIASAASNPTQGRGPELKALLSVSGHRVGAAPERFVRKIRREGSQNGRHRSV
jgi:hypothetical protein